MYVSIVVSVVVMLLEIQMTVAPLSVILHK